MRKSTIIAQCLVNSNMIASIDQAEAAVRRIYEDEFPQGDFNQWNANVNDDWGAQMVRNVGRASTINVKKFIEDLT